MREAFDSTQELLQRVRQGGETAYPNADYDFAYGCWLTARVLRRAGGAEQALPLLDEAQRRFEGVAQQRANAAALGMVSACITERAGCFRSLGRLDDAAALYQEAIRWDEQLGAERDVAVGKGQLGTVRLLQGRYEEALRAYEEARERFTRLNEPHSVAVSWHQTGMVYQLAGQPELAQDAYRKSLAIEVQLGNVAGQASTLGQLGLLYDDDLGRTEEAVGFLHQAISKYIEINDAAGEARQRSNLAIRLRKLRRFEEARQEIRRAIECDAQFGHASEPWKSWAVLQNIETADGNPVPAAAAKHQAVERYVAYRRDGGENHNRDGRICLAVTQALLSSQPATAVSLLQDVSADSNLPAWLRPFIQALQAIVAGSRDRTLADNPDLDYTMAAEILFLLETLDPPTP